MSGEAHTYAFADPEGSVCGVARLGRSDAGPCGLAILFRGGELIGVEADGSGHAGLTADGARLRFDGDPGFDLAFEPVSPPLTLDADSPAAVAGGMRGSDVVCRVAGTVAGAPFEGRGQRGESAGDPDWDRMTLARTIAAWFDDGRAISGVTIRPAGAASHADEVAAFSVVEQDGVVAVADPRVSTTYDDEDRQRAAGLELFVGEEDEYPLRAAGELVAGTSLDLGRLRLDCAFFRWRMGGAAGVGRYDVLRRVA